MTVISNNDIARSIYLASKESEDMGSFSNKVVLFLHKNRFLSRASDILNRLEKIINQEQGVVAVKVESSTKLEEKTKISLLHHLKHRYEVKEIILKENINERLLGGVRLEMNDEIIDLTIRNRMDKLQAHLTR